MEKKKKKKAFIIVNFEGISPSKKATHVFSEYGSGKKNCLLEYRG